MVSASPYQTDELYFDHLEEVQFEHTLLILASALFAFACFVLCIYFVFFVHFHSLLLFYQTSFFIIVLVQGGLAAVTAKLRRRVVAVTDRRVALMNEILNAIRLIKVSWLKNERTLSINLVRS